MKQPSFFSRYKKDLVLLLVMLLLILLVILLTDRIIQKMERDAGHLPWRETILKKENTCQILQNKKFKKSYHENTGRFYHQKD